MVDTAGQRDNHLFDTLVQGPGVLVELLEQRHLVLGAASVNRVISRVKCRCGFVIQHDFAATRLPLPDDGAGIPDGLRYRVTLQVVAIGKPGFFFGHGANANPFFDTETALAQYAIVHHP